MYIMFFRAISYVSSEEVPFEKYSLAYNLPFANQAIQLRIDVQLKSSDLVQVQEAPMVYQQTQNGYHHAQLWCMINYVKATRFDLFDMMNGNDVHSTRKSAPST